MLKVQSKKYGDTVLGAEWNVRSVASPCQTEVMWVGRVARTISYVMATRADTDTRSRPVTRDWRETQTT